MSDTERPQRKVRRDKRRELRKVKVSKHVHWLIRATLGNYIKWRFQSVPENVEMIRNLEPPYLIMGNHGCVWDPFILNSHIPAPIHYVVSDSNFRSRLVSFGLSLVGSIPKTKALSDFETVKHIVKIKHRKGIIGIFPEGQSSWDGHSLPIYYSTAKLVKSLKVPVVVVELKGAFLSMPRWARSFRRGPVHVEYKLAFKPEDLKNMSVADIYAGLVEQLSHDDFAYQRRHMIPFGGKNRAEYLEVVLFTCPRCEERHTLKSSGNLLRCTACGYTVRYNAYGFFEAVAGTMRFDNVRSWNVWQINHFKAYLDAGIGSVSRTAEEEPEAPEGAGATAAPTDESAAAAPPAHESAAPIMREEDIVLQRGFKSMPLEKIDRGSLELHPGEIRFAGRRTGTSMIFPVRLIEGINIQNGEPLEFYFQGDMYRVLIPSPRGNTYKWFLAVEHLQGKAVLETTEPSQQAVQATP
ncbi:MAG: lysophospholipid acyltransferase family protein [Spirochaetota bacterium]